MYKFDVKYTLENYFEYYKFIMIRQRIIRDLLFSVVFIGVAIYWWVDTSEATDNTFLPIFAIIMAVVAPLMNFFSLPMLKKQLAQREGEIKKTHIYITFNDEEVIYENLTVKEEAKVEKPVEEVKEEVAVNEEAETAPEAKEAEVVEEVKEEEKEEVKEEQKTFTLHYANFLSVNETENLFLFALDRQTIVIVPKKTIEDGASIEAFKSFILKKVNPKRVHFAKK